MSYTKRELVTEAFAELALAGYVFDLTAEELNWALGKMDQMIAFWAGKGINLGYPLTVKPGNSDLDQDSNIQAWAVQPVVMNLAVKIAAGKGKQLFPHTMAAAKEGFDYLMSIASKPVEMSYPNVLPVGAGNRYWSRYTLTPFYIERKENLTVDGDNLDFLGGP